MNKAIIITGNLDQGFEFYGPFGSRQEAATWANGDPHLPTDWHVVELYPPIPFGAEEAGFDQQEQETNEHLSHFGKAHDAIQKRLENTIKAPYGGGPAEEVRIIYSAYRTDEEGIPIDNLDEKLNKKPVKFVVPKEPFFGGPESKDYSSDIFQKPTMLDAALCANESISYTKDTHHNFFEGILYLHSEDGVAIYELIFGS